MYLHKGLQFISIAIIVLLLSACGGRSNTSSTSVQGDTITLRYSENLSIVDYGDYTLAQLRTLGYCQSFGTLYLSR